MKKYQSGVVLIISLLILLILTVLGITSMRSSITEELLTRNSRDAKIAFFAANSALNHANRRISESSSVPQQCSDLKNCSPDSDRIYRMNLLGDLSTSAIDASWWQSDATKRLSYRGKHTISEAKSNPRFAIEATFIPDSLQRGHMPPTGKYVYRISGRGTGAKDSTKVVVQQTIVKRFN